MQGGAVGSTSVSSAEERKKLGSGKVSRLSRFGDGRPRAWSYPARWKLRAQERQVSRPTDFALLVHTGFRVEGSADTV